VVLPDDRPRDRGRVVASGFARRAGAKFAVRGGREGLFTPATLSATNCWSRRARPTPSRPTASATPLAVGRPSCTGGAAHLVALVRDRKPARVVVARDTTNRAPAGPTRCVSALSHCRDVRVIAPPDGVKDVRAWTAAGATRADLDELIRAAAPRRLNLTTNMKVNR
jgi:hypothetical protein